MADETVVANEVLKTSTTVLDTSRVFGATVTAGQPVYVDEATNTYKLADANGASPLYVVAGISMNGGVTGQVATVAIGGDIDPGFTCVVGKIYVNSGNVGRIAPVEDLVSGWRTSTLGYGITASLFRINIFNTQVANP